MKIFRICSLYLRKHRIKIAIFACYGIIIQILSFITPYITGDFIDRLVSITDMHYVFFFCIILATVTLLRLVFLYLQSISYCKLQAEMGYEFNRDVVFHIQDLPMSYLSNKDIAQINSQINEDTNRLVIFCLNIFNAFILNGMVLPALFVVCYCLNKQITIAYAVYCSVYIAVYNVVKKHRYKISHRLYESQNQFFGKLFEQMKYIAFIKSNGIAAFFRKRLEKPFKDLYDSTISDQRFEYMLVTIDQVLSLVAEITLYIGGAYQIIQGQFTVGNFIIFSSYFSMVRQSIQYFYNFGSIYQQTMVAYDRTVKILNEESEADGGDNITQIHSVFFNKLSFDYNGNSGLINGFSDKFVRGNIYGIQGENGSGKTTFAKILLGLYNDNIADNMILLNGESDIKNTNKHILRHDNIAYVEQSPVLLDGDILSNILIDKEPSENILHYVKKMSQILNIEHIVYSVSESNQDINSISGGERQKVAIIRALCKCSDILIFDEPTAALDIVSSRTLMEYLQTIKSDKIIIIISHDDVVINCCDVKISCEQWRTKII